MEIFSPGDAYNIPGPEALHTPAEPEFTTMENSSGGRREFWWDALVLLLAVVCVACPH